MVVMPWAARSLAEARPTKEQVGHRKGPHQPRHILPADHRGSVGLFIVAAQLGEDLIKGHPHGNGEAQLPFHVLPQPVGQGHRVVSEEVEGPRHVQPALVDAEGLHQVGVPAVDFPGQLGIIAVFFVVGGQEDQARTFPLGLPDGLGGFTPPALAASFLARMIPWRAVGSRSAATGGSSRPGAAPPATPSPRFWSRPSPALVVLAGSFSLCGHSQAAIPGGQRLPGGLQRV